MSSSLFLKCLLLASTTRTGMQSYQHGGLNFTDEEILPCGNNFFYNLTTAEVMNDKLNRFKRDDDDDDDEPTRRPRKRYFTSVIRKSLHNVKRFQGGIWETIKSWFVPSRPSTSRPRTTTRKPTIATVRIPQYGWINVRSLRGKIPAHATSFGIDFDGTKVYVGRGTIPNGAVIPGLYKPPESCLRIHVDHSRCVRNFQLLMGKYLLWNLNGYNFHPDGIYGGEEKGQKLGICVKRSEGHNELMYGKLIFKEGVCKYYNDKKTWFVSPQWQVVRSWEAPDFEDKRHFLKPNFTYDQYYQPVSGSKAKYPPKWNKKQWMLWLQQQRAEQLRMQRTKTTNIVPPALRTRPSTVRTTKKQSKTTTTATTTTTTTTTTTRPTPINYNVQKFIYEDK